jgi:hypothetical protein
MSDSGDDFGVMGLIYVFTYTLATKKGPKLNFEEFCLTPSAKSSNCPKCTGDQIQVEESPQALSGGAEAGVRRSLRTPRIGVG